MLNLLNYNRAGLEALFLQWGERASQAQRLLQAIHQRGITDYQVMAFLSQNLRTRLQQQTCIIPLQCALEQKSQDGTIKWLLRLEDNNCIETVYIPETKRATLCVSSQVGCALNCHFCATAQQGYNRNLTVAEIIGQVRFAIDRLFKMGNHAHKITNVVMMGMGEPLLNYDAVVCAIDLMLDDLAYGFSKYRVTLSTSGVVPFMRRLAKESPASLAVSLHAANDTLRTQLIPLNKKYPLAELMDVCRNYYQNSNRQIMMEYVMLAGINDSLQDADELIALLQGIPAKVNLIPFNPFPKTLYTCSSSEVIAIFQQRLLAAGINAITRKTRGQDVNAACGQLAGKVIDRTRRSQQIDAEKE